MFSIFSAPFNAGASIAGGMAQERARRQAIAAMGRDFGDLQVTVPRDGLPPRDLVYLGQKGRWFRIVDGQPHIPRVEKRK